MAVKTTYICDLSGVESEDLGDFIVFQVLRDSETTETVVHESALKDELEDGESLLAQIVFRDV